MNTSYIANCHPIKLWSLQLYAEADASDFEAALTICACDCDSTIQNCATFPLLRVLRISRAKLHAVYYVYHTR